MDGSITQVIRAIAIGGLLYLVANSGRAGETYRLASSHPPDELTRIEVNLNVGGEVKLSAKGQVRKLPMSVVANLAYDERRVGKNLSTRAAEPRSFRFYNRADAVIKVDKGGEKPLLHADRRLIGVDCGPAATTMFSPAGPLTREELDLIDIPGNSLCLDLLLPDEPVAIGASWKHSDRALTRLLGLDAVSSADVQSVLGEVQDGVAEMALAGTVHGAVAGVSTEMVLKAKYTFDLELKRITWFALLIKEQRSIGHIGPGLDVTAKLIMTISPLAHCDELDPAALAKLPTQPTASLGQLTYESAKGHFQFQYDRCWYVTSDEANLAVLRLVDRGELVAQCNVSPLPDSANKPISLAEFQQDIERSLGKSFGRFVTASESTNDQGYRVLRVVASGDVSQLPIQWIYYLVASEHGQRVTLACTLEASLAERFGQADRDLVKSLRLTAPPAKTAARPKSTQ